VITHEVGQLERHHRDLMPQQEELDVLGRCRSPSSRTSLSICWKIRYRSRSDMAAIMPDHRERPITPGQQRVPRVLEPHRRSPAVPSLIKFLGLR
jgi:hypothetical protein